jgi:hypothetical protein
MLGYEVSKGVIDAKSASAVLALRSAFEEVENIAAWLSSHPFNGTDPDPLTLDPYGYTADEAYALRFFFETFDAVRNSNTAAFDAGRKMTGLE